MIRFHLLAGAALPCLLAAAPACSQSASPPANDIVVTATRSARALAEVPASVSVVTGDQIESTAARSIDEVLRRIPPLTCRSPGPTNSTRPTRSSRCAD